MAGKVEKIDANKKRKREADEEKHLRKMMIPKNQRRLYSKITYKNKKDLQEVCHSFLEEFFKYCFNFHLVQNFPKEYNAIFYIAVCTIKSRQRLLLCRERLLYRDLEYVLDAKLLSAFN